MGGGDGNEKRSEQQQNQRREGNPFLPEPFFKRDHRDVHRFGRTQSPRHLLSSPDGRKSRSLCHPPHIKPEWYFLANYKFLQLAEIFSFLGSWAPKLLGILLQILIIVIIIFFPFFDKNPERHPFKNRFLTSSGIFFIVVYAILLYSGYIK